METRSGEDRRQLSFRSTGGKTKAERERAQTTGATSYNAAPVDVSEAAIEQFQLSSEYIELKVRLHRRLVESVNLAVIEELTPLEVRREIGSILRDIFDAEDLPLNSSEQNRLINDVTDEFLGFGPLEPLLKDPSVADILVNTYNYVAVERAGRLEKTTVKFKDNSHLARIIERMILMAGRRIDEAQPMVDARLPDGSRINAVIPPVAVDGPLLSIRKFSTQVLDLKRLTELGAMTQSMATILTWIVRARLNIMVSGGTGSGKTTMLNALTGRISQGDRIVTIEDAAELQLQQEHVVRMETRPPNIEGKGEISQRHLVKNALRMRPDRIIVGECRAGEAFDMLQAMNTGHHGSMTTIHANSPRDALRRLEQMIGMSGIELSPASMRAQVASAVDIVIQVERLPDGKRKLVSLQEVVGMEGDVITMQEIIRFEQKSVNSNGDVIGQFVATGIVPQCLEKIESIGGRIPPEYFVGETGLSGRK